MPEISVENDPSLFTITVLGKGKVAIDVLEFSAALEALNPSDDPEDGDALTKIAIAARQTIKPDPGGSKLTGDLEDREVVALAMKAYMRFEELGNGQRPSQLLRRPPASLSDPLASRMTK